MAKSYPHHVPRLALWLLVSGGIATAATPPIARQSEPRVECGPSAALAGHTAYLVGCRPTPRPPSARAASLAELPTRGVVRRHSPRDRQKLDSLQELLALHHRAHIYTRRVIDIPQAWTGLYARSVLLISKPALRLLSDKQLQALVAHEIAHEYLWFDYQSASASGRPAELHQIEFACDQIAAQALAQLGLSPHHLIRALQAVHAYNRDLGLAIERTSHPPLADRTRRLRRSSASKRLGRMTQTRVPQPVADPTYPVRGGHPKSSPNSAPKR